MTFSTKPQDDAEISAAEQLRYSRQIGPGCLNPVGQRRLKGASVLVTRVGGMGGPAAMCLVMAGVGRLVLAHGGTLGEPDLNRQMLGSEAGLGQPRAATFAAALRAVNRFVEVVAIDHELSDAEADDWARRCDVVLSAPPTFAERLQLNRAAMRQRTPLVDAAQWGMMGTLVVVDPGRTACLRCLYPVEPEFEESFPVVGAISSALGSLAALEAIKIISGCAEPMFGRLLTIEGHLGAAHCAILTRRVDCSDCAAVANQSPAAKRADR